VRRRRPDQSCPRAPVRRCHAPLSEPSRRRLRRREFLHGERRPTASSRRSSPVELELTLLSLLAVAGPPPATVAPSRRGDAAAKPDSFSSPSTRSSGELVCRPSCPAGSLTVVTAPACTASSRAALAEAGPASASHDRVVVGRASCGRRPRMRCAHGPSRRRGRGPSATVHLSRAWFRPRDTQIDFSIF
jgi:hypothetical protein